MDTSFPHFFFHRTTNRSMDFRWHEFELDVGAGGWEPNTYKTHNRLVLFRILIEIYLFRQSITIFVYIGQFRGTMLLPHLHPSFQVSNGYDTRYFIQIRTEIRTLDLLVKVDTFPYAFKSSVWHFRFLIETENKWECRIWSIFQKR